jgi:hypothetical protein
MSLLKQFGLFSDSWHVAVNSDVMHSMHRMGGHDVVVHDLGMNDMGVHDVAVHDMAVHDVAVHDVGVPDMAMSILSNVNFFQR